MDGASPPGQYLTFLLGSQAYAVPLLRVREIREHGEVTRVPTMPRHVRGVTNLRGQVIPVVDLALRLGLPEAPVTRYTCDIVMEVHLPGGDLLVMAMMVDAVDQVLDLGAGEILPPPEFGVPVRIEFLHGLARLGDAFALVLHIDRIMTPDEMEAAAAMGRPASASPGAPAPARGGAAP
jgi:purine-binding chemotaxis protein CheW